VAATVVLQAMVGMFARCTQQAVNKLDTAIKASTDNRWVGSPDA
jgi:hypothetical protein